LIFEGDEARHLPLKNEFQSLRPRCRAKRPFPQIFYIPDGLAFRIVSKVLTSALDLDKALCVATQLNIVTAFRNHYGGRSLTGPYFYR
jgi:hypothetical protein